MNKAYILTLRFTSIDLSVYSY